MTRTAALRFTANTLADRTSDAWSADRYFSWNAVAYLLLREFELRVEEAEVVMRSKWTRWAGDMNGARHGHVPAKALATFIESSFPDWRGEVDALCAEAGVATHRERVNLMSKVKYMERIGTPPFMSPACESYWTM